MNRGIKIGVVASVLTLLVGYGALQSTPVSANAGITGLSVPADVVDQIAASKAEEKTYIVQMSGDPLVAYEGGIGGLKATKPAKGKKLNPKNKAVIDYQAYLHGRQNAAMQGAGVGLQKKLYNYSVTFNGFAAKMTEAQADQLRASADVAAVTEDRKYRLETVSTPEFLGLRDNGSAWDQGYVGEDVIIGIMDSGAWPENPSFSDRTGSNPQGKEGKLDYHQIPGWHGKCVPGEGFNASHCNHKMISAQWYGAGFGGPTGIKETFPYEFVSPRAVDGHGVHTASTAGGNDGVDVLVDGLDLGVASGMAPRARIATYKVCWGFGDDPAGGCFGSDSVAAIDQAVIDGVDVINFSISGTRTDFLEAVEVAFLFAADAGVFVAASAGNAGATATVAHPSPWITTVAAGTHDRLFEADVTLGNDDSYTGASIQQGGTNVLPLVYSENVGLTGEDPTEVRLCYPGTLDPALVAGKMVLCDRGVIPRVDKSEAVAIAGGAAMILANTGPGSLNADLHSVPSIHVDSTSGDAIRTYVTTATDPTGFLSPGVSLTDPAAPEVASFSSRGPLQASSDLLKPDIMAPGVDVLAAVSPREAGRDFDFKSGTSMSSPHIAGLAAVVKSAHPDWSPMMIKSALMTTSTDTAATPFAEGTGHVVPNAAIDPGLVYDSGFLDWFGFLCGTGQLVSSFCATLGIDPSDLNTPNIAIGELAGSQTVTRTVTNVGSAGTYNVSVDAPPGIDVMVSPSTLTLASGASASYEVTFTSTSAAVLGDYTFGNLTWSDGAGHDVRSALVVRPIQLAAPDTVGGAGATGSLSFDVTFGYTGDYNAGAHGLEPAGLTPGNVVDDPANDINTALDTGVGITVHGVSVPPGTALARFSLFDDYTDGNDDLDLYVFDPGFGFVGGSGGGTSAEEVNAVFPAAGTYFVVVHGWQTDGPDANYTLFDWSVPGTPGVGTFPLSIDAAPASAVFDTSGTVSVSWDVSGDTATEGRKYLGAVSHSDGGGLIGLTVVEVEDE